MANKMAIFGGGCFWCTEAIFLELRGVLAVEPGYAGGTIDHPTYEQVCTGKTGYVEVIRIAFDETIISYATLVEVFLATHDPTQLNRQGNDIGEQYRSVIFSMDETQRKVATEVIAKFTAEQVYDRPIVTTVEPNGNYFPAEDYHRDYYNQNRLQPYCLAVISPKLAKFRKKFQALRKS